MELLLLILLPVAAMIVVASIPDDHINLYLNHLNRSRKSRSRYTNPFANNQAQRPFGDASPNLEDPWPYYAKPIMTEVEQIFYQRLLKVLPHHRIFAQVQLSQLLGVRSGHNYNRWYHHVSRMSVDYVVCSEGARILAAIELDDSTHLRPDRVAADRKKDKALRAAGIRIVRIPVKGMPGIEELCRILSFLGASPAPASSRSNAPEASNPGATEDSKGAHSTKSSTAHTAQNPAPDTAPREASAPDPSPASSKKDDPMAAQRRLRHAPIPPLALPPLKTDPKSGTYTSPPAPRPDI